MSGAAAQRRVEAVQLGAASVVRPDFPGLDRLAIKLARGLSASLSAVGSDCRLHPGVLGTTAFRAWKAELPDRIAVARYRDASIRGGLLLSLPAELVTQLVDRFYGGNGASASSRSDFGAAERRLFERLAQAASEALGTAWSEVAPLAPSLLSTSFARDDLTFGKPDDLVVVQRFPIAAAGNELGNLELVYPLAALRGVAGLQATAAVLPEEVDPHWRQRLSGAVMQARLPVRTVIARPSLPLGRLVSLAPGDFIPVTLPARVPLTVAGCLLAHGTIGEANGRAAIMIDRIEPGAFND